MSIWQSITNWWGSRRRSAPKHLEQSTTQWSDPPMASDTSYLQAHNKSIELRAVTETVFNALAGIKFSIKKDGKVINESHPLYRLMARPNYQMTGREFRALVLLYRDIEGECTVLQIPDEEGKIDYCPVPKTWVTPMSHSHIKVTMNGQEFDFTYGEDAILFKKFDMENPYGRGLGLGPALIDETSTLEFAAKHAQAYFFNGAKPETIIHLIGAGPDERDKAQEQWNNRYQGAHKAWQMAFMGGPAQMAFHQLTSQFKDLQMVEFRQALADKLRFLWSVPPEILGDSKDSNRATITAAQTLFALQCLEPRAQYMCEYFNVFILPMLAPGERLYMEPVSTVPADQEHRRAMMEAHPECFTVNEIREESGFAPRADGDVYLQETDKYERVQAAQIIEIHPIKQAAPKLPPLPPIPQPKRQLMPSDTIIRLKRAPERLEAK